MNNPNDKSALLRDMAIFDYVAGNQSESAKRNFEDMMQQDHTLREAVEAERSLRASMQKAGELEPVSMSNFDALLSTIEKQEKQHKNESNVRVISREPKTQERAEKGEAWNKLSISRYYATAASVAVLALVFSGFYLNSSAPKFETLSSKTASEEINFAQLVEQTRLAKMTLVDGLSQQDIGDVLRDYDLGSFEAGAGPNQRYVISESAISYRELARWREDSRVRQVELFVTKDEG